MIIAGIDPGPHLSGFCVWDTCSQEIIFSVPNMINYNIGRITFGETVYIIEDVKSFGMAVGESVFSTCKQIGELLYRLDNSISVYKRDVQLHFCNTTRAKDTNIKRVLLDRFGEKGTKKNPGKTYGLSQHAWDAFALCILYEDELKQPLQKQELTNDQKNTQN